MPQAHRDGLHSPLRDEQHLTKTKQRPAELTGVRPVAFIGLNLPGTGEGSGPFTAGNFIQLALHQQQAVFQQPGGEVDPQLIVG